MADKPRFDPSKPFEAAGATSKPKFDPSKPFSKSAVDDSIPALPGTPERAEQMKGERPLSDAGESFFDEAGRVVKSVVGSAAKGLAAAGEMGVSGLTSATGSLANLANAATGAKELPGMKQPGESDADFYKRTREAATYQPRTEGGTELVNSVIPQGIGHVVEEGGKGFERITGSPAAGELFKDAVAVGTAAAPMVGKGPLRTRFPTPEDNAAASVRKGLTPEKGVEAPPSKRITEGGWSIRPSDKNKVELGQKTSTFKENLAGSADVGKELLPKNQRNTMKVASRDMGLPETTLRFTPETFRSLRKPEVATYEATGSAAGKFKTTPDLIARLDEISNTPGLAAQEQVAKLADRYRTGELDGPQTIKTISELRRRSSNQMRAQDPVTNEIGQANRAISDALEAQLEQRLEAIGDVEGLAAFRASRTKLAKIHDYEVNTKAGLLDAQALHKWGKRVPLSGGAKEIAFAAEHAPEVMRHPQAVKNTGNNPIHPDTIYGATKTAAQGLVRKLIGDKVPLKGSDLGYMPPEPPPAPKGPPSGPPPTNLPPSPSSSMLQAQKMAGDLSLADDVVNPQQLPEAPSRLQAETPAAVRGDVPFRATNPSEFLPDDLLEFAPEVETGSIPGGENPRAPGMSQLVPGTTLYPELRAVRGRPDEVASELSLSDDIVGPQQSPGGGNGNAPPTGPVGNPGLDLAADLGIEVVPSAKKPGFFEVRINGQEAPVAFQTAEEAQAASLSIADELLGGLPEEPALGMIDDVFENNASGESAASVEAINRVSAEKAAGQDRFLIDQNGTVTPLKGVDSVDAVARPGQVIAQRGIGASPYSVLDRGGLSKRAAENRINMVLDLLGDRE